SGGTPDQHAAALTGHTVVHLHGGLTPASYDEISVCFTRYSGRYMYHCHILELEDRDMMRPFVTMPPELMPFMACPWSGRADSSAIVAERASCGLRSCVPLRTCPIRCDQGHRRGAASVHQLRRLLRSGANMIV